MKKLLHIVSFGITAISASSIYSAESSAEPLPEKSTISAPMCIPEPFRYEPFKALSPEKLAVEIETRETKLKTQQKNINLAQEKQARGDELSDIERIYYLGDQIQGQMEEKQMIINNLLEILKEKQRSQ